MSSDLNVYMKVLPPFVGKYIFSFLIPDAESVEFGDYKRTKRDDSGYCLKYEVAFCGNRLLENLRGRYLSRIKKANGKHRYYLTTEHNAHICQGCGMDGCRSEYCRGGWEDEKWYSSKYVGKDLENAMCALLLSVLDKPPPVKSFSLRNSFVVSTACAENLSIPTLVTSVSLRLRNCPLVPRSLRE